MQCTSDASPASGCQPTPDQPATRTCYQPEKIANYQLNRSRSETITNWHTACIPAIASRPFGLGVRRHTGTEPVLARQSQNCSDNDGPRVRSGFQRDKLAAPLGGFGSMANTVDRHTHRYPQRRWVVSTIEDSRRGVNRGRAPKP